MSALLCLAVIRVCANLAVSWDLEHSPLDFARDASVSVPVATHVCRGSPPGLPGSCRYGRPDGPAPMLQENQDERYDQD